MRGRASRARGRGTPQAPNRPAGCKSQYIQAVPVRLLMDDNLLRVFIALTAFAVVIQAGILVALYLAVRKSAARMEALATEVTSKTLPTLEPAQSIMIELRPKIETIASNAVDSTTILRVQLGRLDSTLSDILDRTRLQVIRADELL